MGRSKFKPANFWCNFAGCIKRCARASGLTQHKEACHFNPRNIRQPDPKEPSPSSSPSPSLVPSESEENGQGWRTPSPYNFPRTPSPPPDTQSPRFVPATPGNTSPRRNTWLSDGRPGIKIRYHPYLSGAFHGFCFSKAYSSCAGDPCDADGYDLEPGTPPPPAESDDHPFFPFDGPDDFMLAHFLYSKVQMSAGDINHLSTLWDAWQRRQIELHYQRFDDLDEDIGPPFASAIDLYSAIDSIPHGDIPWEGFSIKYSGELPTNPPKWMKASYDVWYRNPLDVMENQFSNPEFANHIDYAAKEMKDLSGKRQYVDLMSGEWAWEQSVSSGLPSFSSGTSL